MSISSRLLLSLPLALGLLGSAAPASHALSQSSGSDGGFDVNACYVCADRALFSLTQKNPYCALSRGKKGGGPECEIMYVIKPTTENGQATLTCVLTYGPCTDGRSTMKLGGLFGY